MTSGKDNHGVRKVRLPGIGARVAVRLFASRAGLTTEVQRRSAIL